MGAASPRRTPTVRTVPLPAEFRTALSGVSAMLRDVPRDCIIDKTELFHWLRRLARRVDDIRDKPMPVPPTPLRTSAPTSARSAPSRALSVHDEAESMFRASVDLSAPSSGLRPAPSHHAKAQAMFRSALPRPRIVLSRKGRQVRVEVRRARAAGQLEMPL